MNLFGVMDVSGSALKAQRIRAEIVASNMANSETTKTESGGPYRRHHVTFAAVDGETFGASLMGQSGGTAMRTGSIMAAKLGAMNVPAGGVQVTGVIEDQGAPLMRFDPQHPDAGPDGYVAYPDINPLTEMVDLMGATRSYGLNASAIQAEKSMLSTSLEILK